MQEKFQQLELMLQTAAAENNLDTILDHVIAISTGLALNSNTASRIFGSPELDQICCEVGQLSLSRLSVENSSEGTAADNADCVFLATQLQLQNGIAKIIEELIAAQPHKRCVILLTNISRQPVAKDVYQHFESMSTPVFSAPDELSLNIRLHWLQLQLAKLRPATLIILNDPHDAISIAASAAANQASNILFFHHCDHSFTLGTYLTSSRHVDFRKVGLANCRQNLGIKNNVLAPLTLRDVDQRRTQFQIKGKLISATCGAKEKFEQPYRYKLADVIAEIIQISHNKHIHVGVLSPACLDEIRKHLLVRNIDSDLFIYIPAEERLSSILCQFEVDILFDSFPVGSCFAMMEAMRIGMPIIVHHNYHSRLFSNIDFVYDHAPSWQTLHDLCYLLKTMTNEKLVSLGRDSRRHYENNHTNQRLQALLTKLSDPHFEPDIVENLKYYARNDVQSFFDHNPYTSGNQEGKPTLQTTMISQLPGSRDILFGSDLYLMQAYVHKSFEGLEISMLWKCQGPPQPGLTIAVHLLNEKDEIIGQYDHQLNTASLIKEHFWRDAFTLKKEELRAQARLGIAIFDDPQNLFVINGGTCDWDNRRLMLHLSEFWNAENIKTSHINHQIQLLEESGLFDEDYYCAQTPAARNFEHGPIAHYLLEGHLAGHSPHVLFVPTVYRKSCEFANDVAPFFHYLNTTGKEAYQTHPLFDVRFYLEKYPDLAQSAGTLNPLKHFVNHGGHEGRDPHVLFSTEYYVRQCKDLQDSEQNPLIRRRNPLVHFLLNVSDTSPHELFDMHYYKQHASSHSNNSLIHFLETPARSFVSPHPIFEADYYHSQLNAAELACENPLVHFLTSEAGMALSPHPLFDVNEYRNMRPDLVDAHLHLFLHYIRFGYREWCEKFSLFQAYHPNRLLHGRWYTSKYEQSLEKNVNFNPLLHYALHQGLPHPFFDPDYYKQMHGLSSSVDALTDCLLNNRAREINFAEPILGSLSSKNHNSLPCEFDEAMDVLLDRAAAPFTRLVVVLGLISANPARMLTTNIGALQRKHGVSNVLVIYSYLGQENDSPPWLPPGSRAVDIASLLPGNPDDHALLLAGLIYRTQPHAVHIVESYPLLVLLTDQWKAFGSLCKYVLYLYGHGVYLNETDPRYWYYNINGPSIGRALRLFDYVITDTEILLKSIVQSIPERLEAGRKTITMRALVPLYLESLLKPGRARQLVSEGHILWASRVSEVKRPDILVAIATLLPEYKFVVYGSVDSDRDYGTRWVENFKRTENIDYRGPYNDFSALDHKEAIAFLYTTETDGVPLVLEEAAALGLPIIAPRVGGIPEFVSAETGWLIEKYDDVDDYVDAIRSIVCKPDMTAMRVKAAQALLQKEYSEEALQQVCELNPEIF